MDQNQVTLRLSKSELLELFAGGNYCKEDGTLSTEVALNALMHASFLLGLLSRDESGTTKEELQLGLHYISSQLESAQKLIESLRSQEFGERVGLESEAAE